MECNKSRFAAHEIGLALVFLCVFFSFGATLAQGLSVNELLASNDTTAHDQDGEFEDWIELYNGTESVISLTGAFLSDDAAVPQKWTFPDTAIAPHSYLVIWCDEDSAQSGLHAAFKLSASGEEVVLTDQADNVIDHVVFGPQVPDISWGRYPDGSGGFGAMPPTIGEQNEQGDVALPDPGERVFGDMRIHHLDLHFYIEDWADSLRHNFEALDREYLPAQLTFNDTLALDSIGVRYKGNSSYQLSRNTPKKPFEFNFSKYFDNLSLDGLHKLNLSNGTSDPSFLRETLAYAIARDYVPAPRTSFAQLSVEGEPLGFYILVEQIDKVFLSRHFENNSGNLYKASDDGATLEYFGTDQSLYEDSYELKTNEDENDWSGFVSFLNILNNTPDASFAETIAARLNIDSCARILALNMALSNFDSYTGSGRNFYFYDDPATGRFQFLPWDYNESFGVYRNNWDVVRQDLVQISNLDSRPLSRRFIASDILRELYLSYVRQISEGPASVQSVSDRVAVLAPLIEPFVLADMNKLYSDQAFHDNLNDLVYVDIGRPIPGLVQFARDRSQNIALQLSDHVVYPGDTNNDGVVDALDVLPLGIYFLNEGPVRDSTSNFWDGHRAILWETEAATYADANGDGSVDEQDLVAVGVNWSLVHQVNGAQFVITPDELADQVEYRAAFQALRDALADESAIAHAMRTLIDRILGIEATAPRAFELGQNYPNPFNAGTTMEFVLPERQHATLEIMNVLGEVVMTLADRVFETGGHRAMLNAQGLPSGIYFARLRTPTNIGIRKLALIR